MSIPPKLTSELQRPIRLRPTSVRWRIVLWLLSLDLTAILVGFSAAIATRLIVLGETHWEFLLLLLVPSYFAISLNNRSYAPEGFNQPLLSARRAVSALLIAMAAVIFLGFVFQSSNYFPRLVVGVGFVISSLLLTIARVVFVKNLERIVGGDPFRTVLIHESGEAVPKGRYSTIIPADRFFDPTLHDPLMYDQFARVVESAHRVIIACHPERRAAWASALKGVGTQGEIVVPEMKTLQPLSVTRHDGEYSLVVTVGPLSLTDRAVKRAFDIACASALLLLLSIPLLIIAIWIRLDSSGPALFRQKRIGLGNKIFVIYKFRSMKVAAEDAEGARSTSREDDRVTRIGHFLRRSSLDEVPQLLNVLKGEMSMVGPRPHALGSKVSDKLFWEIDERYWHRHAAKPGLTGLAQVRGFRGATLIETDFTNRLRADLEYLENWSLFGDMRLIILTIGVIFHRNAF